MKQCSIVNLPIQENTLDFQVLSQWGPFHLFPRVTQHKRLEIVVGSVLMSGVATVEWTYVAIYHFLSAHVWVAPAAGIIAIWEQLTVIPSFCLCESSSSLCTPTGTSSQEMTPRAGTKKLWVCRCSCCISLSACLTLFLGGLESPLRVNHYTLRETK